MSPNYTAPISNADLTNLKTELSDIGVDPKNLRSKSLANGQFLVEGVVIPLGEGKDIYLTAPSGLWTLSLRQGRKVVGTINMLGYNYSSLLDAVEGAISAKSYWF